MRERDPNQHSVVRLRLTGRGVANLASLSELQLAATMGAPWEAIEATEPVTSQGATFGHFTDVAASK